MSLHSVDYELDEEEKAPASGPVTRRLRGEELVSRMFEQVHGLAFVDDALEGARFCLDVLNVLVPCASSMVCLFDAARRDLIVVDARGEGAGDMVLARHGVTDPLMRVVLPIQKAFSWDDLSNAPVRSLARFSAVAVVKRVLVAPIFKDGRCLGAIELVNPLDDAPFDSPDETAVEYVARHYADYLASHGVITDVGAIAVFAAQHGEG